MEVANIYDNGPISPFARIKDNISVWSENQWLHWNINYMEPVPRSSPMMIDMVAQSGATQIAANGIIAAIVVPALQMNKEELLHLRWEPIDDVEGVLWELPGHARFNPRGAHARVSLMTGVRDPYLATTTFYILGQNKDMNLEVRNPLPVVQFMARFVFFGYRYLLDELKTEPAHSTYLPAMGK